MLTLGVVDVDRDGLRGRRLGEALDPSAEDVAGRRRSCCGLRQADQRSLVQQLEEHSRHVSVGERVASEAAREHTGGVVLAYDDATPYS